MYKSQAKQLLKSLSGSTHPNTQGGQGGSKCSIDSGVCQFHYMHLPGIIYLTLSPRSYPKRLAFLYLDEIASSFQQELSADYGEANWMDKISQAARPYQFIKFDKHIQRLSRQYVDPCTRQNSTKLNEDLSEIRGIMVKNIEDLLGRGERLEEVGRVSTKMVEDSKKFKWGAKKLSFRAMVDQYAPIAAVALFVLFVIYFKFIR
jgi:vesicle transport protein SEC22